MKFSLSPSMDSPLPRLLALAGLSALSVTAFASASADLAKADLANRVKAAVSEIKVVKETPVTWTDGGLGLPRPGEMVTKALVPGFIVELEFKSRKFRYTTGGKAIRFGGPIALDGQSLLFIEPVENEANLNGNLVQVSAVGTNPRVLIERVSRYTPCKNGSVLAVRRTSRSGHELLYLAPKSTKAVAISAGMDFGLCAMDDKGVQWAAIRRPGLGTNWEIVVSKIGSKEDRTVPMPEKATFKRLVWLEGKLVLATDTGWFVLGETWTKCDKPQIEGDDWMVLNKSQTLSIDSENVAGKPVTRIATVWFTGARDEVASIPGFEVKAYEPMDGGWVLLSGKRGDEDAAYLVDIAYGMVVPVLHGKLGEVRVLARKPEPMIWMKGR